MLGQTARRRSTWATWASLSARGLARWEYRLGPSASTSRLTVRRLRPNSLARALSDHPWRRRTCNSIQVSPDCKGVPPAVRGFRHHETVRGDLPPVDHDDGPPVLL